VHDLGHQVTPSALFGLAPTLFGLIAFQPAAIQQSVTRLVVQDEVIFRVPLQPRPLRPPIVWLETNRGPKCIPAMMIRKALLSGPSQVDFVLANNVRVRARFDEDCPALDFYGNFYLQPADRRVCAERDVIRSRMGGSCTITQFRQLVPRLRDGQR